MKKLYWLLPVLLVSSPGFSQTPNYDVFALKYTILANSAQPSGTAPKDSTKADFLIWLIKGNNGKTILADAGLIYGVEDDKKFDGINYLSPDSTLPKIEIHPEDVTDIILSREHWDHIDYKDLFSKAHLWMQKEDYNYYTQTSWQKGGINKDFNRKTVRDLVDANTAGRLTFLDESNKEIIPGIKVYISPGEKFNPQYVMVKTNANNVPLASDNVWLYYNLESAKPAPVYGTFDAGNYIKGLQRIKTLVTDQKLIVPGQDAVLLTTFPIISEGVIKLK